MGHWLEEVRDASALWLLRWGIILCLLILPIECFLVVFAPDVQIFGPNPIRNTIADFLESWGIPFPANLHLAGALVDPKKLGLYVLCAAQIYLLRDVILTKYQFKVDATCQRYKEIPLKWQLDLIRKAWLGWRGKVCLVTWLTLFWGFYARNLYHLPHVFGPVGEGLFSSFTRGFEYPSRLGLVLYRAWFLSAQFFVLTSLAILMPAYCQLSLSKPEQVTQPSQLDPSHILASAIRAMFVPTLGITMIAALCYTTNEYNVGEISDMFRQFAFFSLIPLALWFIVGLASFSRMQASTETQLVRTLRRFEVWGGILTLLSSAGVISLIALALSSLKPSSEICKWTPKMSTIVQNRLTEYVGWNPSISRKIIENVENLERRFVWRLRRNRQPEEVYDIIKRLWFTSNPGFNADNTETMGKKYGLDAKAIDDFVIYSAIAYAMVKWEATNSAIASGALQAALAHNRPTRIADEINTKFEEADQRWPNPRSLWFDPTWIAKNRVSVIARLARDFKDNGILFVIQDKSAQEKNSFLEDVATICSRQFAIAQAKLDQMAEVRPSWYWLYVFVMMWAMVVLMILKRMRKWYIELNGKNQSAGP